MKTIIAGSRNITDYGAVKEAIFLSDFNITEVVSGTARGADKLGERWASENNIPVALFPANWEEHGRAAGHIRNRQMGDYADALIALWDGKSKGTKGMIDYAKKSGLDVYVHIVGGVE